MWWTDVNHAELNLHCRSLDARFWSQTLRDYPFLKKVFQERSKRYTGADLFNALYGWNPVVKHDPPDAALAAWIEMFMRTEQFKQIKGQTTGDQFLSAAGAIRLFTELTRPRESVLKSALEVSNSLDQMKALSEHKELAEAGEKAIKQIQQQMADSIKGEKSTAPPQDGQAQDVDDSTTLADVKPDRLVNGIDNTHPDKDEDDDSDYDDHDSSEDDEYDRNGDDEPPDPTYSFSQDMPGANAALSSVQEDLASALLLASLEPGKGCGNNLEAGALKILMDESLATKVTRQDTFRQILRVAGRMMTMYAQAKAEKVPPAPPPIGIKRGGELADVIASELMMIDDPDLGDLFLQRWANRNLICYDHKRKKASGKGPMVFCIDSSGSMTGQPWTYACAVFVSLAGQAIKEHRKVAVTRFATYASDVIEIDSVGKLVSTLDALGSRLGGGTNFAQPIAKATKYIADQVKFNNADIIFISDGYGDLDSSNTQLFLNAKEKHGIRLFGINIDGRWEPDFIPLLTASTAMGRGGALTKLEWFGTLARQIV